MGVSAFPHVTIGKGNHHHLAATVHLVRVYECHLGLSVLQDGNGLTIKIDRVEMSPCHSSQCNTDT